MKWPVLIFCCWLGTTGFAQPNKAHDLHFSGLPARWDEGIPLGNGWLGALIWQKENKLRLSLDRADLWDDRPMPKIDQLTWKWVQQQVKKGAYDTVQKLGDLPYEQFPAPTRIPGAALEFDLAAFGPVRNVALNIREAIGSVQFANDMLFLNYAHASRQEGYFAFEQIPENFTASLIPALVVPEYHQDRSGTTANTSVDGQSLQRLGYKKGTIQTTANSIRYRQPTWNNNYYEVLVQWKKFPGRKLIGAWTIAVNKPAALPVLNTALKEPTGWGSHTKWWKDFWSRSSVTLPDSMLEKQYYLELYKFGCVARNNTPPISLQAIWTADNGKLPPWKGDFHHDLNTQLSYWPGYTSNHLDLTKGFTNWLWKIKPINQQWTQKYFGVKGLNVPGVTTISGQPMGGWIQYSMSPTVSSWLAQHFFWQWKYSADKDFLLQQAYPYVREAATFIKNVTYVKNGWRYLPLSSSPEYNDNALSAWFTNWTNYDLALAKYVVAIAAELSTAAGKTTESREWQELLKQFPPFASNETGLMVAPGTNLDHSHRHHSPYMALYPLQLLNRQNENDQALIKACLQHLQQKGTREWCGYSFSWMASIYARAREADSAVQHLKIFASNFCSPNSFHLNGDQRGGQYSNFTYRPFTLEGNFAFAQGVHELLLQTNQGILDVFPAVPVSWQDVSFKNLRAENGFLVSGYKENGIVITVTVKAVQDGTLKFRLPKTMHTWIVKGIDHNKVKFEGDKVLTLPIKKGQTVEISNGFE